MLGGDLDGVAGRGELQRVVQQIGHRTLEELDVDLGNGGAAAAWAEMECNTLSRRTIGKTQCDVVEHFGQIQLHRLELELGLVEQGQVAERSHHARSVARVAQRHLDQAAVFAACGVAEPALLQRLQAGHGGGQR